jgi:large subunit ribosomal protein L27
MAKTKSAGATKLGRDSNPQYLGVKLFEGESAKTGSIIIRQRGTKFSAGKNVKMGGDNTLYSMKEGIVHFSKKAKKRFDGSKKEMNVVGVE